MQLQVKTSADILHRSAHTSPGMIGELGQEVYMSTAEQCLLEAHASGVEKMMNDGPCQ